MRKPSPPRFGQWLLKSFCSYDFLSTALWDLEEIYQHNLETKGRSRANLKYYKEVLSIIIHLFSKGKSQYSINSTAMLKHNILISLRSFKKFKGTFLINLIGLATGLASTLLIYLWVTEELSMDNFHEGNDRLYQVMQNAETPNGFLTFPWTPLKVSDALLEKFPEVENATTMYIPDEEQGVSFMSFESNYFSIKELWIDDQFLNLLNFPIITGKIESIFEQTNNVFISESLAAKLFRNPLEAIGETVKLQNYDFEEDFIVSGVFEDVPSNSSLQFEALLNLDTYVSHQREYFPLWVSNNTVTYTKLKEETDLDSFSEKIYGLTESYEPRAGSKLFVQRVDQRYLYGAYNDGKVAGGRIAYVRLFSIVAIVILVIACINFMNLSTAKANTRLKELGVKKALGALRKSLMYQYLIEALLLTVMASVLGIILANLFLPFFNFIIGKELSFELNQTIVFGFIAIILITAILAGSYPAIYLSRLKTIASLKGQIVGSFGDIWARKGLVIFQFCISIILIMSVLIVSNQISFIQSKNLGYNRDNVIAFQTSLLDDSSFSNLLAEMGRISGVVKVGSSDHTLTGNTGSTSGVAWEGQEERIGFLNLEVGMGFVETMGIEIVEGRSFNPEFASDYDKILFNETAIKQMGLENPIGQTIKVWGREKQIIGIVKDFHVQSLYEEISPTMIQVFDGVMTQAFVRIQAGTELETINRLEKAFDEVSNGVPFDFSFVDSDYQKVYESEQQVASMSKSFALIAIIISCLGLLGLTSFTAERRSKEIGIRKVLGSGIWRIVIMLSRDFTKMILIALLIGLPVSYFIATQWIQSFAYGIDMSISYFLLAGILIIAIAWITVGFQTLKAAKTNPVDQLRLD